MPLAVLLNGPIIDLLYVMFINGKRYGIRETMSFSDLERLTLKFLSRPNLLNS